MPPDTRSARQRNRGALPYVNTFPAPAQGREVQTMATFHICRVCARPRSDRYHREHPIAPNSLPPPPGICRRCRISGDDDGDDSETPELLRSHARIGIECLVPESAVMTFQQTKYDQGRVYREFLEEDRRLSTSKRRVAYRYIVPEGATMAAPAHTDSAGAKKPTIAQSNDVRIVAEQGQDDTVPAVQTEVQVTHRSSGPDDGIKTRYGFTESEIRFFARDEVERYRQAERLIEDHPTPYAHGKLVPVQRLIEAPPDFESTVDKSSKHRDRVKLAIIEEDAVRPGDKQQYRQRNPVKLRDARAQLEEHTDRSGQDLDPGKNNNVGARPVTIEHRHHHDVKVEYKRADKASRDGSQTVPAAKRQAARSEKPYKPAEVETMVSPSPTPVRAPQPDKSRTHAEIHSKDDSSSSRKSRATISSSTELDVLMNEDSSAIVLAQKTSPRLSSVLDLHYQTSPGIHSTRGRDVGRNDNHKDQEAYDHPKSDHTSRRGHSAIAAYEYNGTDSKQSRGNDGWIADDRSEQRYWNDNDRQHRSDHDGKEPPSTAVRVENRETFYDSQRDHSHVGQSSKVSDWTDRDYWEDGGIVQTASHRSRSALHSTKGFQPEQDNRHQRPVSYIATRATSTLRPLQTSRHSVGSLSYGSKDSDQRSGASYHTTSRSERRDEPKRSPVASTPATYEYEYRHRRVQPASGLVDMEFFEKSPPDVFESKEIFTYRPRAAAKTASPIAAADILSEPSPLIAGSKLASEQPSNATGRGRSRQPQVHFSNKLAFSPTPPGSDDYPPSVDKSASRSLRSLHQNIQKIRAASDKQSSSVQPQDDRGRRSARDFKKGNQGDSDVTRWPRSPSTKTSSPMRSNGLLPAHSESPSRERFVAVYGEPQSDRSSRRRSPERGRGDSHGPYSRDVARSGSLEVGQGSSHGQPLPGSVREI